MGCVVRIPGSPFLIRQWHKSDMGPLRPSARRLLKYAENGLWLSQIAGTLSGVPPDGQTPKGLAAPRPGSYNQGSVVTGIAAVRRMRRGSLWLGASFKLNEE